MLSFDNRLKRAAEGEALGNVKLVADGGVDKTQVFTDRSDYHRTRLTHTMEVASIARTVGRALRLNEDLVEALALLHDIGDVLAPNNHSAVAADLLAPFVSDKNEWIVRHHGLFQGYYYFHHFGMDRDARDKYRDHEYYDACVDFCARWDQVSFDPDYDTLPLEHFVSRVRALFAAEPKPYV